VIEASSLHILIVDDDMPSLNTLQRFFHKTDHLVTVANNGAEALTILKKSPFDLVISDINMPEMDGIQLVQEGLSNFPSLYFVLITGESCIHSFEELTRAGALTCLAKPFRRSELLEIVDWVASLKRDCKLNPAESIASTDRKQAVRNEKSLWNRDQRFQAIMNSAIDAIILMDSRGNITFWNPAAEVIFGYKMHEVIGKDLHSVIVPRKYHKQAEIGLMEFVKSGRGISIGKTTEVVGLRKDQTEFPAELSLSGFKNQDTWHAAGIIRDISDRKQNEKTLLAAHSELERLYQRLNQEYEIAEKVFGKVVRKNEKVEQNIKYFLSAVNAAGGDLFLTASGVPGLRHILLGDFTGHGLSAALGAIPVTSIFYTMAEKGYSLKNIAREINSRLKAVLPTGLYFCACMVEWNYTHHIARVLNFGLPVVIVVNSSGVVKNHIHSQHPPLGILPEIDREFHYVEVSLEHDDCIYLFTDGIIETQNTAGEQFGLERLEQLLTKFQVPEQRFDYICRSINEFRGDTPQLDDMAIAEIKCDTTLNDHSLEGKESVSYYLPAILNLSFTLHPDAMRTNNFIEDLTDLLIGTHIAVRKQKQNIFLILSELYSNALEHGILQMDTTLKNEPIGFEKYFITRGEKLAALSTGWIKIDMELFVQNTNGRVVLHIEDSGRGFDYQGVQKTQPDLNALRGRGVYLVRSLCKEVAIEGAGNKVTAIFEW